MALTYRNPAYVIDGTSRTYHIRVDCSKNELPDILNTANSLKSFAQVEHRAKYNIDTTALFDVIYSVDIMFGESRDCEWFLLKFPNAKHLEY